MRQSGAQWQSAWVSMTPNGTMQDASLCRERCGQGTPFWLLSWNEKITLKRIRLSPESWDAMAWEFLRIVFTATPVVRTAMGYHQRKFIWEHMIVFFASWFAIRMRSEIRRKQKSNDAVAAAQALSLSIEVCMTSKIALLIQ